ncbi:MAG TPA: 3-phosphoshikimate 1-carboxyvinyltransferase [Opitutaceae bacterium]|jgi:3-phosphoshikimate 1-carboxyvinyltransferase|nr:3-phosphoshikimate 1-carboxyvinyltransferase [Opitutaceae bacterium]
MTPLPDVLPIKPFTKPVQGEVTLPGSKSITNRALLLAALCDGPVTLTGALFSDDTRIMAESLRRLGIPVRENEAQKTIHVEGRAGKIPAEHAGLFVGNAGTAARFLTAFCAAAPRGVFKIDGVPQMRKRPMKGLFDALRTQGAKITCTGEEGFFPVTIEAHGLQGGEVAIDASESSQMLSALLMVAPLATAPVNVSLIGHVRWPFIQMTARLMENFSQPHLGIMGCVQFRIACGTRYAFPEESYAIEPDATAASYYAALPLVAGGEITLAHLRWGLQGDTDFLGVIDLDRAGSRVEETFDGFAVSFAPDSSRRGVTQDFNEFSDTFLTLAAIAPLLEGKTTIIGIAHTRKQETDRVAGMARELQKLGQGVIEAEDSLEITPNLDELRKRAAQGVVEIETYDDHRFAMSFAILGCHDLLKNGRPWLSIGNPACCAKTFPNFFDVLESVWENSHQK